MPEKKDEEKDSKGWFLPLFTAVLGFLGGNGALAIYFADRIWPENEPPKASIAVAPLEGPAPLQIAINGAGSLDPEGKQLNYQITIDEVIHTDDDGIYSVNLEEPGTVNVALLVKDPEGLQSQVGATVKVIAPYDPLAFLEISRKIDDLIDAGDYIPALDQANATRLTCVAPDADCARVHAQAAQAQRALARFEEGLISIEKALELDPENLIYTVSQAEFYILLANVDAAADTLAPLVAAHPQSMSSAFYVALTMAMQNQLDPAVSKLERVKTQRGPYQFAAQLTGEIVAHLAEGENYVTRTDAVTAAICGDRDLVLVASGDPPKFTEAHLRGIWELLSRVSDRNQQSIKALLEDTTCG
ncbi:MAG: tetratricopeptide repeat protein [Arenibacterium sp.]